MEFFLLALFLSIVAIEYKINNKKIVSAFLLVMSPYVAIVLVNNLIAVRGGFFSISDSTILILMLGMSLFFLGTVASRWILCTSGTVVSMPESDEPQWNSKYICFYVFVVCCLRILQLGMRFVSMGLSGMMADDFAAFQIDGVIGHFVLTVKPLCAILFYEWLHDKRKNWIYFVVVVLAALLIASSFIKYHIMTFVLVVYLYTCLRNHSYFYKLGIKVLIIMVVFFVLNYLIGFVLRSMEVSNSFYLIHLWKYLAGGTINMEPVLQQQGLSVGQWCYDFFMPLPNMFASAVTKIQPGPFTMEMLPVANNGEASNVISTIGYIFAQDSFPFACFVTFLWGFLSGGIFMLAKARKTPVLLCFASVYFAYNTVSFFSSFFRLSGPWEELLLSAIVICFFCYPSSRGRVRRFRTEQRVQKLIIS